MQAIIQKLENHVCAERNRLQQFIHMLLFCLAEQGCQLKALFAFLLEKASIKLKKRLLGLKQLIKITSPKCPSPEW